MQHYLPESAGRAFGPLGLSDVLRFCRGLDAALGEQALGSTLFLTTPKGDKSYRSNAAVLIGAYLVLKHQWSSGRLASTLGEGEGGARFACSWSKRSKPEEERVMKVRDCWAGLELARDKFWIDPEDVSDDLKMDAACAAHDKMIGKYDMSWLIPRSIIVGADPTTVTCDPNPATCSSLVPPQKAGEEIPEALGDEATVSTEDELMSTDTVCKDYDQASLITDGVKPVDYATVFKSMNVGLILRANFDQEQGMSGKSYTDSTFEDHGIQQANIRVLDEKGGLPKPKDIARAIEVGKDLRDRMPGGVIFVHCKGGFGRSVILACCLAVELWDVPGSALMGWVRIARPGALTTRQQELFLASLRGRSDIRKAANLRLDPESLENYKKGSPSCNVCTVQ